MSKAVLIVEKSDRVRAGLRQAISARGLPIYDVTDAFDAMSALGRADFGAVVVSVGKRQLSLRGLCQLARRRHPGIRIFIIFYAGIDVAPVAQALGVEFDVVKPGTTTVELAANIDAALKRPHGFEPMPSTLESFGVGDDDLDVQVDDAPADDNEPTIATPLSPAAQAALQAMNARDGAPRPPETPRAAGRPNLLVERGAESPPAPSAARVEEQRTVSELRPSLSTLSSGEGASSPKRSPSTVIDSRPPSMPRVTTDPWASPIPDLAAHSVDEATIKNTVSPGPARVARPVVPMAATRVPTPVLDEPVETEVDLYITPSSRPQTTSAAWSEQPTSTQSGPVALSMSDAQLKTETTKRPRSVELPAIEPSRQPVGPAPTVRMQLDDVDEKQTVLDTPADFDFDAMGADYLVSLDAHTTSHHLAGDTLTGSTDEAEALFEGTLDGAGPALLVSLMAQEFNGRLDLKDTAVDGSVFFFAGEPVWSVPVDGDSGLKGRLEGARLLPAGFSTTGIPEGQLLAKLVERGAMTGQAMHDFMRGTLRDAVIHICSSKKGTYAFYEDSTFLDTVPLVKVNSFGLMLETRRRRTPPDELLRLSQELEWKYLLPGPALTPAAPKLKAFVRGADLSEAINGLRRTKHFMQATGLDAIMGSLVVLTLADARLVTIADEPKAELPTVALADSTQVDASRLAVPDSDVADPSASNEEKTAKEEIFALYMRLKPLSDPGEVLGVSARASHDEVQRAFEKRMRQLEVGRIPEGSARDLMVSRVEELRQKVTRAFESLADRTHSS